MAFLIEKLKKFWTLYVFLILLISVGAILSDDNNFTVDGNPVNFLIIGIFAPILISFFISSIYESVADNTFHKMRLLFIIEGIAIPSTLYSFDKHIAGLWGMSLFSIFITIQIFAFVYIIWVFRKTPFLVLFYLVGLFMWFYFMIFYYRLVISTSQC